MHLSTQMARKRPLRLKRIRKIERVSKAGQVIVTRAEFDALIKLLNERGEIVNDLRRELESIYRELADDVRQSRRDLQTQFTRIAQLQQELDELKRKNGR